jgi:multidrug resistance efflux pump
MRTSDDIRAEITAREAEIKSRNAEIDQVKADAVDQNICPDFDWLNRATFEVVKIKKSLHPLFKELQVAQKFENHLLVVQEQNAEIARRAAAARQLAEVQEKNRLDKMARFAACEAERRTYEGKFIEAAHKILPPEIYQSIIAAAHHSMGNEPFYNSKKHKEAA